MMRSERNPYPFACALTATACLRTRLATPLYSGPSWGSFASQAIHVRSSMALRSTTGSLSRRRFLPPPLLIAALSRRMAPTPILSLLIASARFSLALSSSLRRARGATISLSSVAEAANLHHRKASLTAILSVGLRTCLGSGGTAGSCSATAHPWYLPPYGTHSQSHTRRCAASSTDERICRPSNFYVKHLPSTGPRLEALLGRRSLGPAGPFPPVSAAPALPGPPATPSGSIRLRRTGRQCRRPGARGVTITEP